MNFQFGEPNDTQNYSNHLSIALHLNHPERKKGTLYFSLLNSLELSFLVFLLIILVTLGNFLLLCMILYEKYGMDSKKRTVTNMLLSRIIFVQILCNIFIIPLPTIGQMLGNFSEYILHSLISGNFLIIHQYQNLQINTCFLYSHLDPINVSGLFC